MKVIFSKRSILPVLMLMLVTSILSARPFDELYPRLAQSYKDQVFSEGGVIRSVRSSNDYELSPVLSSGINLYSMIEDKRYPYLTESLLVIPYTGRTLTVLDAYNALGRVRNLKGLVYNSHTRNAEVALFEDATRLDNARRTNSIPDPPAASSVPSRETVYIRLKDANFGNTYYQADLSATSRGIMYSLSNYKTISYLFFPVMKEGRFNAILYMEPLTEGMLVYSIAGTDVSDFVAGRINIPSAISKRLAVFMDWITVGIKAAR